MNYVVNSRDINVVIRCGYQLIFAFGKSDFGSMNWVLILQYFKILKPTYMKQKTARFEYVTRVYPNRIQNP